MGFSFKFVFRLKKLHPRYYAISITQLDPVPLQNEYELIFNICNIPARHIKICKHIKYHI